MDSWNHPALFIIVAIEMLFPFLADLDANLVLCALYFEVCTNQCSLNPSADCLRGKSLVGLSVTNKKLLEIIWKNICTLPILLKVLYNTKTNIRLLGLKLNAN